MSPRRTTGAGLLSRLAERSVWDEWAEAAAQRRGGDAALALLASRVTGWEDWREEVCREGLGAAVWQAACEAGVEGLFPPEAADALRSQALLQSRLKQAARESAAAAGCVLDSERISWLLGPLPGHSGLLPERRDSAGAARVLVAERDADRALLALEASGWRREGGRVLEKDGCRVLLSALLQEESPLQKTDFLMERPAEADLGRYRVKTLGAARVAFVSCLQAFFVHQCRPASCLLDVAQTAGRLDRREKEELVEVAREAGLTVETGLVLALARMRQGVRAGEDVERRLLESGGLFRLRSAVRALAGGEAERAVHLLLAASDASGRDRVLDSLLWRRGRGGPGALQMLRALLLLLVPGPFERRVRPDGEPGARSTAVQGKVA